MKGLIGFTVLVSSTFAQAGEIRTRELALNNGFNAVLKYEFEVGSSDVAHEGSAWDQIKNLSIVVTKKNPTSDDDLTAMQVSVSSTSYGTTPDSIYGARTETRHVMLSCGQESAALVCKGDLGNVEDGYVYNHGGDFSRIANQLLILTNYGVVYSGSLL